MLVVTAFNLSRQTGFFLIVDAEFSDRTITKFLSDLIERVIKG